MQNSFSAISISYWPEWPTVEGRRQGHDSVDNRQKAEEQHKQQQAHVKVVGAWGFENSLMRYVAAHHCPALVVHWAQKSQNIQTH